MAQLRLKRLFLLSLVASLSTCAVVAIAALLLSQFNQTTGRILGTLATLGFHSAMAMACAASLEKQRRPVLSVGGLILFALNFALMIICIWWSQVFTNIYRYPDECILRAIGTTAALSGAYLLAIPCADLAHAKRWQPLPQAGLAICTIAFSMLMVCTWAVRTESELFGRLTAVAAVLAFSCAHQCMLGRVPAIAGLGWLARLATGGVWLVAALLSWMILLAHFNDDPTMRFTGAAGVLDAVSTIALFIMAKVKGVEKIEGLESTPARLSLQCPRCSTQQTLNAGPSKCGACGLKFRIDIEEPRCAKCGYLLWQLPERRCPECGTTF